MDKHCTPALHRDAKSLDSARRASEKVHRDGALDEALRCTFPATKSIAIGFASRLSDVLRGNYAKQEKLIMGTSLKPAAETARQKSWAVMNGREKTIFVTKLCLMFASFGWIYGNTLAPNEVKP